MRKHREVDIELIRGRYEKLRSFRKRLQGGSLLVDLSAGGKINFRNCSYERICSYHKSCCCGIAVRASTTDKENIVMCTLSSKDRYKRLSFQMSSLHIRSDLSSSSLLTSLVSIDCLECVVSIIGDYVGNISIRNKYNKV